MRTYVVSFCLGVALLAACEAAENPDGYDGTNQPATPGTLGGTTAGAVDSGAPVAPGSTAGGTTGFPSPTTGGAGATIGAGGFLGAAGGNAAGGSTSGGSTAGGSTAGGTTAGGIVDAGIGAPGDDGGVTAPPVTGGRCPGLPAVTDYAAKGPFDVKVVPNAGPDGTYYLFRPDATLGKDGFKHPVAVWGNGILTTPDQYQKLLGHLASHGFVVIACPSSSPERPCLNDGMEWLVKQNSAEGPMKDKLDITKEITIGYSWGGGAAIDTANRPNVKATVSIHGMPPREGGAWTGMKSPLLLFTSTGDTFVSASGYVTPNYNSSRVTTFYATLQENVGHLYPIDEGAISCIADLALGGPCAAAIKEQAPTVAWLRYWVCDDESAKKYFFGADCTLCKAPWKSQSKPAGAFM